MGLVNGCPLKLHLFNDVANYTQFHNSRYFLSFADAHHQFTPTVSWFLFRRFRNREEVSHEDWDQW